MKNVTIAFKSTFRALHYRNYRLFFFGQGISLIGTWMQNIAMSWLAYRLTHSVFLLGLIGFLSQIVIFLRSDLPDQQSVIYAVSAAFQKCG